MSDTLLGSSEKKPMFEIEIHEKRPEGFSPQVEVAACYLEVQGKFLVLQRAEGKLEGGKWGVPAGKLEKEETPLHAAMRELFEETGIQIDSPNQAQSLGALYIRKPQVEYVYHLFKIHINDFPSVHLSDEHQRYTWASLQELEEMPLMAGAKKALEHYQKTARKKRTGASMNSYLVLRKKDKILFLLRKNTGYCDGMWSLIAGHVEDGESATSAMIREAEEEVGLTLLPSQIEVVHIMHRKTDRMNIDVFFACASWQGTIENREPEKCEKLEFFPLSSLPSNVIDYLKTALEHISHKQFYSEFGWNK